jgi:hypothetical protein
MLEPKRSSKPMRKPRWPLVAEVEDAATEVNSPAIAELLRQVKHSRPLSRPQIKPPSRISRPIRPQRIKQVQQFPLFQPQRLSRLRLPSQQMPQSQPFPLSQLLLRSRQRLLRLLMQLPRSQPRSRLIQHKIPPLQCNRNNHLSPMPQPRVPVEVAAAEAMAVQCPSIWTATFVLQCGKKRKCSSVTS